jgi:hypothetical protein
MDRRTEPPIWPPDESEIPEENEIPERRRGSFGFLFSGGTCARDGLAYAAGLALTARRRLEGLGPTEKPGTRASPVSHSIRFLPLACRPNPQEK